MKMNLSARDRRAVMLGVGALAVILVFKFAVMPVLSDWGDTRDRIDEARATLDEYDRKDKRLADRQQRLELTYGPAVTRPLDDVEATKLAFHKVLQDRLKSGGFKLESLQPQAARSIRKHVPGVAVIPVRVVGKCQMQQLAKSLAELRKAERLIIVDHVDVSNDPKKPAELKVAMVLSTVANEPEGDRR